MARDPQLLLRLNLCRQPVAVPSEPALDATAAHCPVARHGILDETGQQVPVVRKTVGERRTVVEDELVVSVDACVATLDGAAERVVPLPAREHVALDRRQVGLRLDGGIALARFGVHWIAPGGTRR
jgi:hypothetical protein